MPPPRRRSVLSAFLWAPLTAPAVYAGALLALGAARALAAGGRRAPGAREAATVVVASFAVGAPLAYAAALAVGLPAVLWARRRPGGRRPPLPALIAGGAAAGWTVALVLAPGLRGELFSIPFPWWAGAALGVLSAAVFWRMLPHGAGAAHPPAA